MRRIITIAALLVSVTAGSAMADRYHGGSRDHRFNNNDRRVVVRDHRNDRSVEPRRDYRRDYHPTTVRRDYRRDYRYVDRRPVYVNNGRYVFNGGYARNYYRPAIHHRYYDFRVRPQIIVENYDPVPGYTWIAGHWDWNGYEWTWSAGHYIADPSYAYSNYDDGYSDNYYQSPVSSDPCD